VGGLSVRADVNASLRVETFVDANGVGGAGTEEEDERRPKRKERNM